MSGSCTATRATTGGPAAKAVRPPWIDRHAFDTVRSQTRAPKPGSVPAEGGGTATPTLGGGFGFSCEHGPVAREVAR
jgi:hypothetical protein